MGREEKRGRGRGRGVKKEKGDMDSKREEGRGIRYEMRGEER